MKTSRFSTELSTFPRFPLWMLRKMWKTLVQNVENTAERGKIMPKCPFTELEGLRIAAEMEKRGGEFYRLAARVTRSGETKSLLTSLAADEAIHLKEFQKLYEKEAADENAVHYPPETGAYLAALAADIAFPEGVVGLANSLDCPEAILQQAIRSEEDSIRFYGELARASGCEDTAHVFNDIIKQEKGHLSRLQKMLSDLK